MDRNSSRARLAPELTYRTLESELADQRARPGGLPSFLASDPVWESVLLDDTYNSCALDGNKLSRAQVQALLQRGVVTAKQSLRDYLWALGYASAATWVYQQLREPGEWATHGLVTTAEVSYVHECVVGALAGAYPSESSRPGHLRHRDLRARKDVRSPPSSIEVPAALNEWVDSLGNIELEAGALDFVADAHARFERTQPFDDGNGVVSRLLLNLMLVRLGYTPAIIYLRDRSRYESSLRRADRGDPSALATLIAHGVIDSLARFGALATTAQTQLEPLASLSTPELKASALRVAIERGRLRARKSSDGHWLSTREWVDAYVATKYQRGAT